MVVHPGVPVNGLTFAEVRKLLFGDRQYWTPDLRVTLVMRAPVAREREIVLRTIYQMTEAQFRQYWISKVFRAEAASGPRIVYSNEEATGLVGALPGAISFIDVTLVPKGLKDPAGRWTLAGRAGVSVSLILFRNVEPSAPNRRNGLCAAEEAEA